MFLGESEKITFGLQKLNVNAILYSSDIINALQKHLLFSQDLNVAQSYFVIRKMSYNTLHQGLNLKLYIDEQIISRLVEDKLNKLVVGS